MSRDEFLQRVRQAAEQGRRHRVEVKQLPDTAGYVGAREPCETLAQQVRAAGGNATLVDGFAQAAEALERLIKDVNPQGALCWEHEVLDEAGVARVLDAAGIRQWSHRDLRGLDRDERREKILAAEVGISSVTWAVAETGSLALASGPGSERVISLTPPVHIALVARRQILPDLFDLFGRLEDEGLENLASNIALVTGPSKTGDLELKLTTGVHGPGEIHVLVIREGQA